MKKLSKVQGFETFKYACAVFFVGNFIVYSATTNGLVSDQTLPVSFFLASFIFFLGASAKVWIKGYLK